MNRIVNVGPDPPVQVLCAVYDPVAGPRSPPFGCANFRSGTNAGINTPNGLPQRRSHSHEIDVRVGTAHLYGLKTSDLSTELLSLRQVNRRALQGFFANAKQERGLPEARMIDDPVDDVGTGVGIAKYVSVGHRHAVELDQPLQLPIDRALFCNFKSGCIAGHEKHADLATFYRRRNQDATGFAHGRYRKFLSVESPTIAVSRCLKLGARRVTAPVFRQRSGEYRAGIDDGAQPAFLLFRVAKLRNRQATQNQGLEQWRRDTVAPGFHQHERALGETEAAATATLWHGDRCQV